MGTLTKTTDFTFTFGRPDRACQWIRDIQKCSTRISASWHGKSEAGSGTTTGANAKVARFENCITAGASPLVLLPRKMLEPGRDGKASGLI